MSNVRREPMDHVDAAWYHMEDPTNLMMVTGVMFFRDPIEFEKVVNVLQNRFIPFDRFRQRVVDGSGLGAPHWEDDPHFDLNYHVVEERLPDPGGYEMLKLRAGELMSMPLDYNRPLWRAHLVENCGEGNALIMRIHHCIADGIALMGVLLAMAGKTPEESLSLGPLHESEPSRFSSAGQLFRYAENAIHQAGQATGKLLDTLSHPGRILDMAKVGTQSAVTAAKLVLKASDPPTPFKGDLCAIKRAAWSQPVPLVDIKSIKNITRATVNDVLLTAMCGGLRHYLEHREFQTEGLEFRAAVPVNLRDPKRIQDLGNTFGLVFLDLPIGIKDPLDRLFQLKKNMDALKKSPEAVVALGILKAVGMTPTEVQKIVVNIFGTKSTAVMTNVPGPTEPLYFGGKQMDHIMFWVPRSGNLGLGISILSYNGEVRLGVATDAGLIPDPEVIIDGFHKEMNGMMNLVRQVQQN